MNTKLAQLSIILSKIDRRYLQVAYFAIMLAGLVFAKAPADGGGGGF